MFKNLVWHNSIFSLPESKKIHESLPKALLDIALQKPDSPAVILEEKTYTFRDLASRIAGLSDEINALEYYSGPIALLQKVGLDAIAAWFACSLSGRTFLLLEPENPTARIIELIKLSGCTIALVDNSTSHILKDSPEVFQFISDGRYNTLHLEKELLADIPAMIFPTSGSTGNPKLITYSTTTIQAKVQSSIQLMEIPEGVKVMIAGSHSNYGFLHHALVFLLSGNAVFLSDIKVSGFDSILNAITKHGVRHVRFTPSLFRKLALMPKAKNALSLLDAVRFSGEPLLENDLMLAQSVLNPDSQIQNIYGSTESSLFIWKSSIGCSSDVTQTLPIGRIYPLSSYSIRPLEDAEKDTNKGELLIRSKYHAIGDYKDDAIDKNRFPLFEENSEERIYATGDIVELLEDGNLKHLGRIGRMVKIRGNRVNLTEIEQQLSAIPGVIDAIVIDVMEQDDTVIYGFVTTESTILTTESIRIKLSEQLPGFMIPKRIEILTKIPLLAGGKVDFQTLKNLFSTSDSNNHLKESNNETALLIQIWDSNLWKGAHNHNSNYFSLGGDSLGFMVLLEELEQNFGKSLSPEELRTQCTLKNLAVILGIDYSITSQPTISYKNLKVSLIWPNLNSSKGVALAMPGYKGTSNSFPFKKAGLFQDYDIWIIEFPIQKGNMLHENSWLIAVKEIVQGIKEGILPSPRLIFGFSFGGGLAWIVSRFLANSLVKPDFVIMVDAPALHHRLRIQYDSLKEELKNISDEEMPPVLHIRSSFSNNNVLSGNKEEWSNSDNILKVVDLPTVDHFDMINWEVLALSKDAVSAFLDNRETNFQWKTIISPPNLLGCHIFYALNGNTISLQKVKNELTKDSEVINRCLLSLAFLMYRHNDKKKSKELTLLALQKWPDSGIMHFLNRRISRNSNLLFSEILPKMYPKSIVSTENNLASLRGDSTHNKPLIIRHFYLFFDVSSALIASKFIRIKKFVISYTHHLKM